MREITTGPVADLEARVIALQTLVGHLLKLAHETAPADIDARLAMTRKLRDTAMHDPAYDSVGREAVHLQVAMLEHAARPH